MREKARAFLKKNEETFVDYKLRLRTLCEDFALAGRPRTLKEMYVIWKRGLRYTRWEMVVDQVRYDPIKRKKWTILETIYVVERIMVGYGNEPILRDAVFILKKEGNPTYPYFQVWRSIGPLYVYTHDDLLNHRDWLDENARNHFYWHGLYLDILPTPIEIQAPHLSEIGMQVENELMEEEDNENRSEEEEQEDLEEDPNWMDEEGNRTPQPIRIKEDPNHESNPSNMEFDQDLQIPDSNIVETENELDSSLWKDIYEDGEYFKVVSGITISLVVTKTSEESMLREARATDERIWNEVGNEVMTEENREVKDRIRDEEEGESDQEELVWPSRRRRLTVRAYLIQFARRNDGGSSSRDPPSTPTPGDS